MLAVTETGTRKELLRQKSIADLVTAHKITHPEIEHNLRMSLERLKKSRSPDETAYLRSQTKYAAGAGRLSEQKADRIDRLLDEEEEALRTGNELRAKQAEEFLEVEFSDIGLEDEGTVQMRARDLIASLRGNGAPSTLPREKFTAAQEKGMSVIESEITADPRSAKSFGHYERLNEGSSRPHVYVRTTKSHMWPWSDVDELRKVKLGKRLDGTQIRAKDVAYSAGIDNMTVEEYLDAHPEVIAR